MVRILRRAAMGCILLFTLGSCQVLFVGVFPASAAQITARADLSASIAAAPASSFSFTTVQAGNGEYVLLFSSAAFDGTKPHLLVMDSALRVLSAFTLNDLVAFPNPGDPFTGRVALSDVNGQVVVGNIWFDVLPAGFSFFSKASPGFSLDNPSVTGQPSFAFYETNFRVNGPILQWDEYDLNWGFTTSFFPILGTPSPPPQGQLRLIGAFEDRGFAGAPDVFVFRDDASQRSYFLQVPKADIDGGLSVIGASDVFTYAAANYPPLIVKSNLDPDSIAVSRAGVVAYDEQARALIRFPPNDPGKVSSMSFDWKRGMKLAAGLPGNYVVVWDPASRTVSRYDPWW